MHKDGTPTVVASETAQNIIKPKGAGPGRTSTSCSECQRRKQKCDKQWPCRHCQDRRVPHLCQFKKRSCDGEQTQTRPTARARSPPKRKFEDLVNGTDEASAYAKRLFHLDQQMSDLGYVPSGKQTTFQTFLDDAGVQFTTKGLSGTDERNEKIVNDCFPPRPYADVLVHNYCDNINYVYCILHPESFLEEYAEWWQTRRTAPNVELESLLLRVCAISAQFLPEPICERLETEMSEDIGDLKQRWHEAAERLSNSIRPGKGGTKHVQQLFLTASYYKTEAMFVESWHALAGAVRIAQEIGMHKDSPDPSVTDFDREIRRSVWMSLYTWDRLMSFIFDRPAMISRVRCKLLEPKLNLWNDPIHPELPSPILSRVCEFRMVKHLDKYLEMDLSTADIRTLIKPLHDIKEWLDDLPAVFRTKNPDTSFDDLHRRVKMSRLGLHTTAYIVLFHLLQPCLIDESFPSGSTLAEKMKLRSACMDYCTRMTDVVDRLASSASHSRFHMSFCLFETSATACAALVKDKNMKLPRRLEVAKAMGRAQDILARLGPTTAVARSSGKILTDLMAKLQVDQPDTRASIEEGRRFPLFTDPNTAKEFTRKEDSALGSSIASPSSSTEVAQKESPENSSNGDVPVKADIAYPQIENLEYFAGLDFGVVDAIWDWDTFDSHIDLAAAMMDPQFTEASSASLT